MLTAKIEDETFSYSDKFLKRLDAAKDKEKLEIIENLKQMLIDFLLKSKSKKTEESVYILFKLCAESRPKLLNDVDFYTTLPSSYCLQNIQLLSERKRYHSMALIYNLMNKSEDAFSIWKK